MDTGYVDGCRRIARELIAYKGHELLEERDGMLVFEDAEEGDTVLAELRVSEWDEDSIPALEVSGEDMGRFRSALLSYLSEHPALRSARYDLICVMDDRDACKAKVRHMVGACRVEAA